MKMPLIAVGLSAAALLAGCTASVPAPTAPVASVGGAHCEYLADGTASKQVSPPSTSGIPNSGTVDYTMVLSGAQVGLKLDRAAAPCAVNSFISLAAQGYFDKTDCHRLANFPGGFQMLQCGDPTGTGMGGPGYRFAEELTGKETYPAGTLAMANTGQPASQGSQFFMVFGDTQLRPDYTVFGHIDAAGIAALNKIADGGVVAAGADGTGKPKLPATIESVTPR